MLRAAAALAAALALVAAGAVASPPIECAYVDPVYGYEYDFSPLWKPSGSYYVNRTETSGGYDVLNVCDTPNSISGVVGAVSMECADRGGFACNAQGSLVTVFGQVSNNYGSMHFTRNNDTGNPMLVASNIFYGDRCNAPGFRTVQLELVCDRNANPAGKLSSFWRDNTECIKNFRLPTVHACRGPQPPPRTLCGYSPSPNSYHYDFTGLTLTDSAYSVKASDGTTILFNVCGVPLTPAPGRCGVSNAADSCAFSGVQGNQFDAVLGKWVDGQVVWSMTPQGNPAYTTKNGDTCEENGSTVPRTTTIEFACGGENYGGTQVLSTGSACATHLLVSTSFACTS